MFPSTYIKNGTFIISHPVGNNMNRAITIRNRNYELKQMYQINKDVAKALGYQLSAINNH